MDPLVLPSSIKRFTEGWRLASAARGGTRSLTGSQQFVVSAASHWEATLSFNCLKPLDYAEADGFIASLDGPANPFLCGPEDWRGRPWNIDPISGGLITPAVAKHDNPLSPGYALNPDTTSILDFKLSSAALMNATTIVIQRNKGGWLRRGQYFSINQRLHIITALQSADPSTASGMPASGVITVSIRPWLRLDYAAGTVLQFAKPEGLMRLTADSTPRVERTASPLSELQLAITEYFG